MEKGGGGGSDDPATRAAGGMCDRFLTFLTRNLTMSRVKSIADGPKNGGGAGQPAMEGAEEGEEEDEFAIPIERAEFDYEFGGGHGDGGYSSVATILEESAAMTTTTTRDVPEPKTGAAADGPVGPAPAAMAVEETKVRKSVTIKEDRLPEQEGGAPAAPLERKRSLFKKRQASSVGGGGDDEQRVPRRSGLRPRIPPVLRVPSNINERSSTFIEERKKSFVGRGGGAKPAPDK
ncbi:hypothetical protein SEVIR_8G221200v4 [Setaria viridis]|uniref:Uncharacterized protein n=1 Tax=Setaria viridis TaxID=4556 RepID=A0A4U6TI69_SETVI|nr:uncharacterized protein LOC117867047 [Setaria viridis]TKW02078.1 hypothetical protein SEVIR_8G221200v2 [Setaria viridis]